MRATIPIACFALAWVVLCPPAAAVSLELVLAIDVSASVNDEEFELQRSGTATAFRDPQVQAAVSRAQGGVAVVAFQWASRGYQVVAIPWTRLQSKASLDAFADAVEQMPRKIPGGGTAIHAALAFAHNLFAESPFVGKRRVIDLAGNGVANNIPATVKVRDRIVASGIVINGLAIEELKDDLTSFFREDLIGGDNAFVVTAWSFEDFARAMRLKLLREVGDQPISRRDHPGIDSSNPDRHLAVASRRP